jgi:agmatine deiminase
MSQTIKFKPEIPHGYRLPAEWENHDATWIGWPHNSLDWPGKITPVSWVYGEMIRKIAEGEIVRIIVESKEQQNKAVNILKAVHADLNNVEFFIYKTDRGWLRDSAPAFVKKTIKRTEFAAVNFNFNGWAKYPNYKNDNKIPSLIARDFKLKQVDALHRKKHVTLEGGAIDSNGNGTLITTEECLMSEDVQVRNPGFSKQDYHEVFRKYLGITNTIWLGKGIDGDDTHGHVDDVCRFVNPNTVVLVREDNESDVNFRPLRENKERLKDAVLEDGSKLNVVEIPMPSPLYFKGERLPASYANFYVSNSQVLVPTFNDPKDRIALGILAELFDRKITGIHAVDLVWGYGTIHCLTHEQPSV